MSIIKAKVNWGRVIFVGVFCGVTLGILYGHGVETGISMAAGTLLAKQIRIWVQNG